MPKPLTTRDLDFIAHCQNSILVMAVGFEHRPKIGFAISLLSSGFQVQIQLGQGQFFPCMWELDPCLGYVERRLQGSNAISDIAYYFLELSSAKGTQAQLKYADAKNRSRLMPKSWLSQPSLVTTGAMPKANKNMPQRGLKRRRNFQLTFRPSLERAAGPAMKPAKAAMTADKAHWSLPRPGATRHWTDDVKHCSIASMAERIAPFSPFSRT
mmetsp:Transcript_5908/g.11658  ORF Transcript_5908/g.11658 Transcript_5908/m.11658 type:complete len:212 (-) Transcript_5908:633-1268(-)